MKLEYEQKKIKKFTEYRHFDLIKYVVLKIKTQKSNRELKEKIQHLPISILKS